MNGGYSRPTSIEFFFIPFVLTILIQRIIVDLSFLLPPKRILARMSTFGFRFVRRLLRPILKQTKPSIPVTRTDLLRYFATRIDEEYADANGVHRQS